MDNLIESLIFIVFVIVAIATKLLEKKSGKKILRQEEIFFPEEPEEQEEEKEWQAPEQVKPVPPAKKIQKPIIIESPEEQFVSLTADKLEEGIILSTILGPPRSRR